MNRAACAALLALAIAACHPSGGAERADGERAEPRPIASALFSSLPIAQPEGASMADLLASDAPTHWALPVLAERGQWRALDWLGNRDDGYDALAGIDLLVLAQPRALAPEENVALDKYVRGGGRVLLFADPVLTQESAYGLGDPRRPAHTVLLSPIFARWGVTLERDESDDASSAAWRDVSLPLAAAGRFGLAGEAGEFAGKCELEGEDRLVSCAIGKGRVLALADAALLEPDAGETSQRRADLLELLIDSALGD